jgi:hypothetical protein
MEDLTNFGWETYDSLFIGAVADHVPLMPRFGYLPELSDFFAYRRKEKKIMLTEYYKVILTN